jgi:hypothetical protein
VVMVVVVVEVVAALQGRAEAKGVKAVMVW